MKKNKLSKRIMDIEKRIQDKLEEGKLSLTDHMDKVFNPEQAKEFYLEVMIRNYGTVFEGNFLSWMAAAHLSAQSPYAKYAAAENLDVELRDDHPHLLHKFLRGCSIKINETSYKNMASGVGIVRASIAHSIGNSYALALMAVLENLSLVFIPFLRNAAKKLEARNEAFEYLDVHGEADIEHADQFVKALVSEINFLESDMTETEILKNLDKAMKDALYLLKNVFSY